MKQHVTAWGAGDGYVDVTIEGPPDQVYALRDDLVAGYPYVSISRLDVIPLSAFLDHSRVAQR